MVGVIEGCGSKNGLVESEKRIDHIHNFGGRDSFLCLIFLNHFQ